MMTLSVPISDELAQALTTHKNVGAFVCRAITRELERVIVDAPEQLLLGDGGSSVW
jgi:hypothetical protein